MSTVLGIGTDVVDVARVRAALDRHGDRFEKRAFTELESAYCRSQGDPVIHFAGRFAAKEAVLKALGTGWAGGIAFTDVEVDSSGGAPQVRLLGKAAAVAEKMGAGSPVWLTLSHTRDVAVAFALLCAR